MNNTYPNTPDSRSFTTLGWLKQRKSSVATLVAGVAILVLSAASGFLADESGIDWLELSIYLCAIVVVATQGGRLLRACAGLARKSTTWVRGRQGDR